MAEGGTLTIRTAEAEGNAERGRALMLSISDTGEGIDTEMQARVFEPFFTTKGVGQGTGLGLRQVYGFATPSGGDVFLESATGQGPTTARKDGGEGKGGWRGVRAGGARIIT